MHHAKSGPTKRKTSHPKTRRAVRCLRRRIHKTLIPCVMLLIPALLAGSCQDKPETSSVTPATSITASSVSADGVSIRYQARGSGNPALVFVHGWSCDRTYWNAQVEHFARKHRVVTLDLAGHGESGSNRKPWTIRAFGEDVASVVNALKLDRIVLIGHSMGGPVVLEAARRLPDRVIGVVGIDAFNEIEERPSPEQIAQIMGPLRANFKEGMSGYVRPYLFTAESDPVLIEKIVKDMSAAPSEVALGALEELFRYNTAEAIDTLQLPIYSINCDLYPTNIEAGRRHASTFEVELMPGVGHFLMMEDPPRFNGLLDKVLERLTVKSPST